MSYLSMWGTFSKGPEFFGLPSNLHVTQAEGQYLTLSDGTMALDWVSGLGGNLIGYNPPGLVDALTSQLHRVAGSVSLPTALEEESAELLCVMLGNHVPGWTPELISARFAKTGTDATTMAVRLARAVTGRDSVITFKGHYHGWGSWSVSRTPPAHGITKGEGEVIGNFEFGELSNLPFVLSSEDAAVILEVGITDPDPNYLQAIRQLCYNYGVLLIVDEVVTGLRYGLGGACERYGIRPDLVCMGKGVANGRPVSAVVGARQYLDWFNRDDPVFCSSTHWGDALDLAACKWTLENWTAKDVEWLWAMGDLLIAGMGAAGWQCVGHGARSLMQFNSDYERAFFIQGMYRRGVLMNRPNFPTRATTTEMIEQTVYAAGAVREDLEQLGAEELRREMEPYLPRVLFRNR